MTPIYYGGGETLGCWYHLGHHESSPSTQIKENKHRDNARILTLTTSATVTITTMRVDHCSRISPLLSPTIPTTFIESSSSSSPSSGDCWHHHHRAMIILRNRCFSRLLLETLMMSWWWPLIVTLGFYEIRKLEKTYVLLDRYFVNRSFYSDRVAEKLAMSSPSSLLFDNKKSPCQLKHGIVPHPGNGFHSKFPRACGG